MALRAERGEAAPEELAKVSTYLERLGERG